MADLSWRLGTDAYHRRRTAKGPGSTLRSAEPDPLPLDPAGSWKLFPPKKLRQPAALDVVISTSGRHVCVRRDTVLCKALNTLSPQSPKWVTDPGDCEGGSSNVSRRSDTQWGRRWRRTQRSRLAARSLLHVAADRLFSGWVLQHRHRRSRQPHGLRPRDRRFPAILSRPWQRLVITGSAIWFSRAERR